MDLPLRELGPNTSNPIPPQTGRAPFGTFLLLKSDNANLKNQTQTVASRLQSKLQTTTELPKNDKLPTNY